MYAEIYCILRGVAVLSWEDQNKSTPDTLLTTFSTPFWVFKSVSRAFENFIFNTSDLWVGLLC